MRFRIPAGVVIGGKSRGGRFATRKQLDDALHRKIRVPRFIDEPAELARLWCERFGIECDEESMERDDVPDDTVVGQKPYGKNKWLRIFSGERLYILVSIGVEYDVGAVEWEMAVEYDPGYPGASPVDINIRFTREDGAAMREAEAQAAFQFMKDSGGEPPDGYLVAGVDWRNPRKSSAFKSGSDADLAALWAPIYMGTSFRLGAVDDE